tara:strand:- start:588 stop:713 length:126 start_codon:yes stop_codon:yes gene_type:complete
MEVLFYVGMIVFGFVNLCNESIEDVERDFGLRPKEYIEGDK